MQSARAPTPVRRCDRWNLRLGRIERRLQEWQISTERNKDSRQQKQELIARKSEEAARFETEREGIEQQVAELTERIATLRANREGTASCGKRR